MSGAYTLFYCAVTSVLSRRLLRQIQGSFHSSSSRSLTVKTWPLKKPHTKPPHKLVISSWLLFLLTEQEHLSAIQQRPGCKSQNSFARSVSFRNHTRARFCSVKKTVAATHYQLKSSHCVWVVCFQVKRKTKKFWSTDHHLFPLKEIPLLFVSPQLINPFTPKSNQFENSLAASPELNMTSHNMKNLYRIIVAYPDKRWVYYQFSLPHLYIYFHKVGRMYFLNLGEGLNFWILFEIRVCNGTWHSHSMQHALMLMRNERPFKTPTEQSME